MLSLEHNAPAPPGVPLEYWLLGATGLVVLVLLLYVALLLSAMRGSD